MQYFKAMFKAMFGRMRVKRKSGDRKYSGLPRNLKSFDPKRN